MPELRTIDAAPRGLVQTPRPPTVLVVDDEVMVRFLVSEALREAGIEAVEATDANEALAILGSGAGIDAMVTDVRMPGPMDGFALAAAVRAAWPSMKVIMVSGSAASAPAALADAFFAKPYRLASLVGATRQLLGLPDNDD